MNQSSLNHVPEDSIQREIDKVEEKKKKQEDRIRKLEIRTIQTVNLYFVFQAVILASASSLKCNHWWVPLVLSLLAAALNLCSLCGNTSNTLKAREELDQDIVDLAFMKLNGVGRAQVSQVLPGTPLNLNQEIVRPKPDSGRRWKRYLLAYFSMASFVGFSGVIIYGCYTILCHSGNGKCAKHC